MSLTLPVATMRITSGLREAEVALDAALLKQSQLLTEMIAARLADDGQGFIGQPEVMRIIKAQQSVTASANDLARVHGGLLEIGREKALIEDCPESRPIRGQADEPAVAA
jgi:hypothetical protein